MGLADLQHEAEWRRCRKDVVYFLTHYWWIRHPVHGRLLFDLRPEQIETLDCYQNERKVVILKARQIGWSTTTTAYAVWATMFQPDRKIIFMSRREREAKDLLAMARYGYDSLPEWMRNRARLTRDHLQLMPFENGSEIVSEATSGDPARGSTAWLVVMDEAAFWPDADNAWASVEPTVDIGGRAIILSTANGVGNWFHEMWNKANDPRTGFTPLFFPWWVVPERDETWYSQKEWELPLWQLHQEYPSSPDEAFLRSGNAFFDLDVLRSLETKSPKIGTLEPHPRKFWFQEGGGQLRVFAFPEPNDMEASYVIGADVALGIPGGDYSSAHVINARNGLVVAHWWGSIEADEFGDVLADLGEFYGNALIGCEANSHGTSTLHRLRQLQYPNLYIRHSIDKPFNKRREQLGWWTDKASKPLMLDELGRALRYGDLQLQDEDTIKEMMGFVRDTEDGSLHGSPHDDRVISLAIANQMLKHAFDPKYAPKPNMEGTVQWWIDLAVDAAKPEGVHEYLIGQPRENVGVAT